MKDRELRPEGVNESQIQFSSDFGLCSIFNHESQEIARKADTSQLVIGRTLSSSKNTPDKVWKQIEQGTVEKPISQFKPNWSNVHIGPVR